MGISAIVTSPGGKSVPFTLSVPATAAAIFRSNDGTNPLIYRAANNDVVAFSNPIHPRDTLVIYAIHRHPDFWPEPERFDPHRENVGRHVGFGAGIHFCLGAPLARLEMRVALERLNARLPGLQLQHNQELRYKPNLTLRGLERLLAHHKPLVSSGAAHSPQ